jgi:3-oxoacyl-[acyl-carrier-protein] synthase-3
MSSGDSQRDREGCSAMKICSRIAGLGHYLPKRCVTSAEVEEMVNAAGGTYQLPRTFIERLGGVKTRYWREAGEECSDLAAQAMLRALKDAEYEPNDVDVLIFAAASQDVAEPATANIVQAKIGANSSHVFDIKNACTSVLNGLDVARMMVESGDVRVVAVSSGEAISWLAETGSKLENREELETRFASLTLGDAGAAIIVDGQGSEAHCIYPGSFVSSGQHWELCTTMAGGSVAMGDSTGARFRSNSRDLMKAGSPLVQQAIKSALASAHWEPGDVNLFVPHQFSPFFLDYLVREFGFDRSAGVMTIDSVGNTAAASIPLALSLAREEGRLSAGSHVLLISAAAGVSAAAIPFRW